MSHDGFPPSHTIALPVAADGVKDTVTALGERQSGKPKGLLLTQYGQLFWLLKESQEVLYYLTHLYTAS